MERRGGRGASRGRGGHPDQSRSQSATRRGRGTRGGGPRWQNHRREDSTNRRGHNRGPPNVSMASRESGERGNRGSLRDINLNSENGEEMNKRRFIGYHKLKSWSDEVNAGQLVLWMANEIDAIEELLGRKEMQPDWYILLLKICQHILSVTHQKQALRKVLTVFVNSDFFGHYLIGFEKEKRSKRWLDAKDFFDDFLVVVKEIMDLLPQYASKYQLPLELLQSLMHGIIDLDEEEEEDCLQTIHNLQEKLKKIEQRPSGHKKPDQKALPYSDSDAPPEDFRQLSVIPVASDLTQGAEPFVRAVLSKGAYRDEDHYLDVQFRLMREDFIQPLRNGLNEFKEKGCKKGHKSSDIRLYFDVQIIGMTCVNGINHVLQFDVKPLKSINWEHSKRFINGSLLCLSKDNFENVFFATVSFRNPKDLKEGIINVEFKTGLEAIFCSPSTDLFIMAETTAYFEAYNPVLEGLKELEFGTSFQKYIIYCQKTLKPPEYLLRGVQKYDLSCLTKSGDSTCVSVLNTLSWPGIGNMKLNESQREAVQLALTKELAIIQGPPGTGKTYVGLNVMRVLLDNQGIWASRETGETGPILVLCYTNHALDQFLEGVVEFCPKGVVRVGGRSTSEIMEGLNLRNLKRNRELSRSEKTALWKSRMELAYISETIDNLKSKIDSLYTDVQKETILQRYMLPEHLDSLLAQRSDSFSMKKTSQMKIWLNASNSLSSETLPLLIKSRLTTLILQKQNVSFIDGKTTSQKLLQNSLARMNVLERAGVYQGWLNIYFSQINVAIFSNHNIREESRRRIFNDQELGCVIPPSIMLSLQLLTKRSDDFAIETWLLGLNNNLNNQLNDVEKLIHFFGQTDQSEEDEFDDAGDGISHPSDRLNESDFREEEEIAKAISKVKETNARILIKAESLGIGTDLEDDNEGSGWQTVTHKKPLSFSKLRHFLTSIQPMSNEEEICVSSVWDLDMKRRFALYNLWTQRYQADIAEEMENYVYKYKDAIAGKQEIRTEGDIEILKNAKVIGMTTTGAAKYRALLQVVTCQIVVVEEAAEVLEAHIITSISKKCKHLILIGDHQQLKPNPTVYTLAKDYHLDLSLFERLINNGIQHVTLKEQHRMRQSISKIMRHIYPHLQDHISVTKYDNVRGVEKNIFFITHKERESEVDDAKSKSNSHEASYLVALLNYFLLQGYDPGQITILATYVGQIFMLRKELKAKQIGDGVRVTTVDNFQGEENDIILLSLVRSNAKSKVGFLKVDNRVCVALSRAKKGLFAIGNFEMLASQSPLWNKIVETAKCDGSYGDGLIVACPNHSSLKNEIQFPDEFSTKCPEGGCGRSCEFRLPCGHTCPLKCHAYDSGHDKIKCVKKCAKSCPNGHNCKKLCIKKCGDCTEKVKKIIPHCGHTDNVPCFLAPEMAVCSQLCTAILDCDHQCPGKCGECHKENQHAKCMMPVDYFWPCGHICKVPCYKKPSEFPCPHKCDVVLDCGHKCTGSCSECVGGKMHVACTKQCGETLPCGHKCLSSCSIPCPPCSKVCNDSCRHSKCGTSSNGHACKDECIPCQEPCLNKCKHKKCSKKCSEDCNIDFCKMRCELSLRKCLHPCSGVCGELCICALCHTVSAIPQKASSNSNTGQVEAAAQAGVIKANEKPSDKSDSNESPLLIKIPSCGHIFVVNELDSYVESFKVDIKKFHIPCPECNKGIQNCIRYNKIINMKISQREIEKRKIRQKNEIRRSQRRDLQESLHILKRRDLDGNWDAMTNTNVDTLNTFHEIESLNLKTKFSFVLDDTLLLDSQLKFSDAESAYRIKAVQRLSNNITHQQKSDFQNALKQFLLDSYIKTFEENSSQVFLRENSELFKATKRALKAKPLEKSSFLQVCTILRILEKRFEDAESFNLTLSLAKKTLARDLKILDSKDIEMLCHIVMT